MAYYDRIRTPSAFRAASSSQQAVNFVTLQQSHSWESAASRWGTQYLFACRVICKQPGDILPLLANGIHSGNESGVHPCIENLIEGPREGMAALSQMAEPQIVRAYELESLGYVWAALAPLLQADSGTHQTISSQRPVRERNQPERNEYVSSEGFQISSSPLERSDTASSSPSSVGYMEGSSAPLVEDYTVRFLSCFIRCVLNYIQPVNKDLPFIQYRDERLAYICTGAGMGNSFQAIDDGGVQVDHPDGKLQVAMLEAKRGFQAITDGHPTVSDELLAQIVGETLALRLSKAKCISAENIVSVVAVKYYVKMFHFNITEDFTHRFETLHPADANTDLSTYLKVESTIWFDMRESTGRKYFIRHLVALVAWADAAHETGMNFEDSELEDSEAESSNAESFMDMRE
ncbi:hypothetical protein FQN50_007225 [Emmonsiellopsis sp. PD_5]|nr:hypothetical protein FQN50_007225 [Emmonsiellopsis sp. PD_5]